MKLSELGCSEGIHIRDLNELPWLQCFTVMVSSSSYRKHHKVLVFWVWNQVFVKLLLLYSVWTHAIICVCVCVWYQACPGKCEDNQACVQCVAFKSGQYSREECNQKCPRDRIQVVDSLPGKDLHSLSHLQHEICTFIFMNDNWRKHSFPFFISCFQTFKKVC